MPGHTPGSCLQPVGHAGCLPAAALRWIGAETQPPPGSPQLMPSSARLLCAPKPCSSLLSLHHQKQQRDVGAPHSRPHNSSVTACLSDPRSTFPCPSALSRALTTTCPARPAAQPLALMGTILPLHFLSPVPWDSAPPPQLFLVPSQLVCLTQVLGLPLATPAPWLCTQPPLAVPPCHQSTATCSSLEVHQCLKPRKSNLI